MIGDKFMYELNKIAFVVKPTELMFEWIQTLPQEDNSDLTFEDIRQDCTVLLLPMFDDDDEIWDCFESMATDIFENELAAWTPDEDKWPTDRSLESFHDWFQIEQHNLVLDLSESED